MFEEFWRAAPISMKVLNKFVVKFMSVLGLVCAQCQQSIYQSQLIY